VKPRLSWLIGQARALAARQVTIYLMSAGRHLAAAYTERPSMNRPATTSNCSVRSTVSACRRHP
jgi:hypothetical protein